MNVEYVRVESMVKPETLTKDVTTVYIRKDITEETRTNEQGETTTFWSYQEAAMSHEEFDKYITLVQAQNAINGVDDSGNISKLLVGQAASDEYQLSVMSAIADLYETLITQGG